jgi:hypothetical protein
MGLIEALRAKFEIGAFEFSRHATDQALLRDISVQEIREAMRAGEVIEDYPDDKYGPGCLVLGRTLTNRPLHIQCSYPARSIVKIVTLYEPTVDEWIDYRVRR